MSKDIFRKAIPVAGLGFLQSYQMFHQHCQARYLENQGYLLSLD